MASYFGARKEQKAAPVVVKLEKVADISVITLCNPPVNALSPDVIQQLGKCVQAAEKEDTKAVVVRGEKTFCAGADITQFAKQREEKHGKAQTLDGLLNGIEQSRKPLVACIDGFALGGGLELALACHYRIATPKSKVGLPEVRIGLLPGAGGTQRLPRLIGTQKAIEIICSGAPISAAKANSYGIVDKVVDVSPMTQSGLLIEALQYARTKIGQPIPRCSERMVPDANPAMIEMAKAAIAKQSKGLTAPLRALEAVAGAAEAGSNFNKGLKVENDLFRMCLKDPQSTALQHVFFAERKALHIPSAQGVAPAPIKKVAVLGAGLMGSGIAMNFVKAGIPVKLFDVSLEAVEKGLGGVRRLYQNQVKKKTLKEEAVDKLMGMYTPAVDYAGNMDDVDLVVEAVFENMELKKKIFKALDEACPKHTILASNTSSLDIDEMASSVSPERRRKFAGMHFFSPAHVMQLLENVQGADTDARTKATIMWVGKKIGKKCILVGNCESFVANRIMSGYQREAAWLVEEGADYVLVDKVLRDFGLPTGAFAMQDIVGTETATRIAKEKQERDTASGVRHDRAPSGITAALAAKGRFGQKSGKGWFKYEEGSRTPIPDPETREIIAEYVKNKNITQRVIGEEEILERCILPIVNESAKVLEEGVALRASDVDLSVVFGYGFPPYRGGPCMWADTKGLRWVVRRLRHYSKAVCREYWEPSPFLVKLSKEGKKMSQYQIKG